MIFALKQKSYSLLTIHYKLEQGYIALVSAIVISFLLITITVSLGLSGFFGRFDILDSESKERSSALTEACIDTAILKLAENINYSLTPDDHAIPVEGDTCNIVSISPNPTRTFPITIQTQACINKSVTNLSVIIDSNFDITSWEELPNFLPNTPCV